jgi:hypothetical protein
MADFSDLGGQKLDFSDLGGVEIKSNSTKQKLMNIAQKGVDLIKQSPSSISSIVGKVGRATGETLMPPTSTESLNRLMNIRAGQFGVSRGLQSVGQRVTNAVDAAAPQAPSFLQFLNKIRPGTLTPSSAQEQIGSNAATEGALAGLSPIVSPIASKFGRGVGNVLERTSGSVYKTPGVLRSAFNDPSLFTAPGVEEVRPVYKAAKAAAGDLENLLGNEGTVAHKAKVTFENLFPSLPKTVQEAELTPNLIDHRRIVTKALKLAKTGKINPAEAQTARMSVDALNDSGAYSNESINGLRGFFDKLAKSDNGIKAGDIAYQRAIKADALREAFPVNKGGGTSIAKLVPSLLATKLLNPAGIALDAMMFSPAVQGLAATGAGIGTRAMTQQGGSAVVLNSMREALKKRRQTQ